MKPDEELRKTFKIFLDENEIINIVVFKSEKAPEDNTRVVELVKEDLFKIFNKNPQKSYNVFVDLLPINKFNEYGFSSRTRKASAQIAAHNQIKKAVIITSSLLVKTAIGFIMMAARKSKYIKCFSNKKEAVSWLKEEK